MCGPHHCLGRGASAPNTAIVRTLLQRHQNASIIGQRCAGHSPNSANRKHQITRHPRRTSPPLRPSLSFWYTHRPRESVRYLSRVGHAARIPGIIGAAAAWQFNGMRRSRWLLALLLASQGFQKFFGQEGLDQDRDTLRRNRVHRLRSGVAGHHGGRYVPAKGGTQVPDGLDTIR